MQIQINTDHNIEGHEALAAQVRGVVESALSHLSDHITRVEVHLSDESSHKSTQNDKRCMMEARLEGRQPIAVTDEEATVVQAVDGAAGKLARLIESTLGRQGVEKSTGLTHLRRGRWATNKHTEVLEMNPQDLIDTAGAMVADDRGLLAMDESNPTCNKRFGKLGIPQTVEARRDYRELIVTTSNLGECISGVILYDETIRQQKKDGTPFVKVVTDAGIIPGIKVDTGAKDQSGHPGEKVTEGLDGLRERLAEYSQMGARFAKWRAVIAVGDGIPTRGCIEANAQALARYAALCQEAGLVPVVEPEVLMDGAHTLERCSEVTEEVLRAVFNQLYTQRVMLEGMILKPNMVLPGLTRPKQETVDEVADATVRCLLRAVPGAVPGITFLSGGQSSELATARLNAMNVRFKSRVPWALAFSFARAIQQPALEIWRGEQAHVLAAQQALYHRARCNRAARRGEYTAAMEKM